MSDELFHNSLLVEKISGYLILKNDIDTLEQFKTCNRFIFELCKKLYKCYGCTTHASAYNVVAHLYPLRQGCMFKSYIQQIFWNLHIQRVATQDLTVQQLLNICSTNAANFHNSHFTLYDIDSESQKYKMILNIFQDLLNIINRIPKTLYHNASRINPNSKHKVITFTTTKPSSQNINGCSYKKI